MATTLTELCTSHIKKKKMILKEMDNENGKDIAINHV